MKHSNKKFNYILLIFICLTIIIFSSFITNKLYSSDNEVNYSDNITIQGFSIVKDDSFINDYLIIRVGDSYSPEFTYLPEKLSEYQKDVIYEVSNSDIALVDYKGNIKGLKEGTTSINVISKYNNGLSETINVKVVSEKDSISFSESFIKNVNNYTVDQVVHIDYVLKGIISVGEVKFESSNPEVAKIDGEYFTAKSIGSSTIKITSLIDETYSTSIDIHVYNSYKTSETTLININNYYIDGFRLTEAGFNSYKIRQKYEIQIDASGNGNNTSGVYFSINDESLIEIESETSSSIKFKCLNKGHLVINIISVYDESIYKTVEFDILALYPGNSFDINSPSKERFININDVNTLYLNIGDIEEINFVSNYFVFNNDLTILSSNDCVEVNGTTISAVSQGKSTISITYDGYVGYSYSFDVIIKESNNYSTHIESISQLNNKISSYDINNTYVNSDVNLILDVYPLYANNFDIIEFVKSNNNYTITKVIKDKKYYITLHFNDIGYTSLEIKCIENENLNLFYEFNVINKDHVDYTYSITNILERGQTSSCNVTLNEGLVGVDVSYTSSNPDVISVGHNGELVGLSYGTSTITITATDGVTSKTESFECTCVEEKSLYDSLQSFSCITKSNDNNIELSNTILKVNDTFTFDISYTPLDYPFGDYYDIIIDDSSLISYEKKDNHYTLTCLKAGKTKVTVYPYANSSLKLVYDITISNIMPEFMLLDFPYDELYAGDKYQFACLVDWRATYSNVEVLIDDESIISLTDDYFTINKKGNTSIHFIIDDNDSNNVRYIYTLDVNTINHDINTRIARYGYVNFIVKILSQILVCILLGVITLLMFKDLKLNFYLRNIIGLFGGLIILIIINIIKMKIPSLLYETNDIWLNIISYIIGTLATFIILLIKHTKTSNQ